MGLLIKLQNGDTQLKSLKFGKDRPNGGDSKQPYIKKGLINDTVNPSLYNDFVVRGGIQAPLSALEDVARLTKYFADISNPSGILFTAKQNLLSRVGTKTEASKGVGYANSALNEGAYTPLSTLAEAGIVFAGGHIPKQGIDPVGLFPGLGINKYQDVIVQNQLNPNKGFNITDNRLSSLLDSITFSTSPGFAFNGVKKYDIYPNESTLISYEGGAGSNLGYGNTNIKFSTGNNSNILKSILNPSSNVNLSNLDKTQTSLFSTWNSSQFSAESLNLDSTTKEDFRTKLTPEAKGPQNTFLTATTGYTNDFEKRFNLSGDSKYSPGSRLRNRSNPNLGSLTPDSSVSSPLDSINAYPIYKSETSFGSRYKTEDGLKDIIEFSIAILNNDDQNTPGSNTNYSYRKYMHFRAFVDSFSDSYDAEWNAISYMGRGEKFYKYGGFDRKMSLGFTVVAQSKNELNAMYDKLNFLASSLAPEYLDSLTSGYMCGNIAYITLGDYINDQPGIITSLTFDIPEESPWEISREDGLRQLPHMIKVSINFTPIQKFRPSKQTWTNDFDPNGRGKTESTLLYNPGNQRYIDPTNPYGEADVEEIRFREGSMPEKLPPLPAGTIPLTNQNLITN